MLTRSGSTVLRLLRLSCGTCFVSRFAERNFEQPPLPISASCQFPSGAFSSCGANDGGGVHSNSGVPNHGYALLVDGGTEVEIRQVFENEDGSHGVLYLVSSDTTLNYDRLTTLYRTRWHVEPYHKSLKQNASLEKSPTRTVRTQTNHLFAAMCGYIKLELLKPKTQCNHFALRAKVQFRALQLAFAELRQLQPVALAA